MPANDADLETDYSDQDYDDVSEDDATRVAVEAEGDSEYVIHQFKDYVGAETVATVKWNGQSNLAPSASIVRLQIYNYNTTTWDNLDSDNGTDADNDFDLEGNSINLTNYKSPGLFITCRVWQQDA